MTATIVVGLWGVWLGAAPVELPAGFSVPADFSELVEHRRGWDFGETAFDFLVAGAKASTHQKVQGRLWELALAAKDPALRSDVDHVASSLVSAFEKDGWTVLKRMPLTARKQGSTGALWLSGSGNGGFFRFMVALEGPPPRALTLPSPGGQPEAVSDAADVPYALPFPGAKVAPGNHQRRPFEVMLPNAKEATLAVPSAGRWYDEPPGVSSFEFVEVYRRALTAAGWDVTHTAVGSDGVVVAHYAKSGRDVWLYTRSDSTQQSVTVADIGADAATAKLKAALATAGHIALYGIYFDTDSAVPRPESEATLKQVLALLEGDKALALEVQGHTDDTSTPAHNQPLSDARAASVRKWLVDHGIAAARLTSKGYAATVPVADNKTAEGRARNRRVELAKGKGS